MQALQHWLRTARERGASDVFLRGDRVMLRIAGNLQALDEAPTAQALAEWAEGLPGDDCALEAGGGRCRVNRYRSNGEWSAVLRLIDEHPPAVDDLGLPEAVRAVVEWPGQSPPRQGLVLIVGATGSGKSTTIAALLQSQLERFPLHLVTLEDPIEYRFAAAKGLVSQREVGRDLADFTEGLHAALRQSPDVLLIGELRSPSVIRLALTAAETGHLVFATLHAPDTIHAVDRIVQLFPGDEQPLIRQVFSDVLQMVIAQRLHRRVDADGRAYRVADFEVLVGTTAVRNLIREGRVRQMASLIETGSAQGMRPFDSP